MQAERRTIVELCLRRHMFLGLLLFVLILQDLSRKENISLCDGRYVMRHTSSSSKANDSSASAAYGSSVGMLVLGA